MFKGYSFSKIEKMLDRLSRKELLLLERKIRNRLYLKMQSEFKITDRVKFDYQGKEVHGTIVRINPKTVTIVDENDRRWNVSPEFLSKIKQ